MLYWYFLHSILKGENKLYKAYYLLKDSTTPANRYKFALVCIKMQKYTEAEKSLIMRSSENSDDDQVVGGAAGYYLLGTITEKLQVKQKDPAFYYSKALDLDPTLWVAFEKLCKLEPRTKPENIFKDEHPIIQGFNTIINGKEYFNKSGQTLTASHCDITIKADAIVNQPPGSYKSESEHDPIGAENRVFPKPAVKPLPHPSGAEPMMISDVKRTLRHSTTAPQGPASAALSTPNVNKRLSSGKGPQAPQKIKANIQAAPMKSMEEIKTFATISEPSVNPFVLQPGPLMPMGGQFESSPQPKITLRSATVVKTQNNIKPDTTMMALLRQLGNAYQCLATYRCNEAIKLFKGLPKSQYNTGWILTQVGRALFEGIRYAEAEKVYREALNLEPYRLEGIEYYSTCLWHMKKQVDLCELSNKALNISLFAPETWCAVGNAFSLQKEHETALRFFNRAIQLNPYFAYAHTLSGHEYVSNEDFEQAKKCYTRAMSCDERHYNAFWGMGNIFLKQEKYEDAIKYFKHAISINSKSSVLFTYLGMTYFHNRQPREALDCFEIAEKMDPNNPLNKYQKATVLISLNQLEEALHVLEELNVKVPREAPVHVLMGKIYKKMGNKDKALAHYNMAMDLDPKEANMIKSLIDRLDRESDPGEENEL